MFAVEAVGLASGAPMPLLVSEVDCRDGALGLRKYVEELLEELVESLELTSPSIIRGPVKMAASLS